MIAVIAPILEVASAIPAERGPESAVRTSDCQAPLDLFGFLRTRGLTDNETVAVLSWLGMPAGPDPIAR